MKPFSIGLHGCTAILLAPLFALLAGGLFVPQPATAETAPPAGNMTEKMNAYVGCINRLSARSYESRKRYFSWAAASGPTGRERIIYGTYTIYDTSDCRKAVAAANAMEPHDAALEAAATAYVAAVSALEPLLKEADAYYSREDYKDDRMAKGKALHPRLVAAWDAFAGADQKLRDAVEAISDQRALEKLAAIEQSEGRKARYYIEALMIQAKRVVRAGDAGKPDLEAITQAVSAYEDAVKGVDAAAGAGDLPKVGSLFMSDANAYLVTAKQLMRRIRDHVPYSSGDKMMINAGSGWMVEGSPARLVRDYNELIDAYNRGPRI
jgi:Protein of unknown function (DUF3829)